jgi:hypothetical protein
MFVYLPNEKMPRVLRVTTMDQIIQDIFKTEMSSLNLSEFVLITGDQIIDRGRSLAVNNLSSEC